MLIFHGFKLFLYSIRYIVCEYSDFLANGQTNALIYDRSA